MYPKHYYFVCVFFFISLPSERTFLYTDKLKWHFNKSVKQCLVLWKEGAVCTRQLACRQGTPYQPGKWRDCSEIAEKLASWLFTTDTSSKALCLGEFSYLTVGSWLWIFEHSKSSRPAHWEIHHYCCGPFKNPGIKALKSLLFQ